MAEEETGFTFVDKRRTVLEPTMTAETIGMPAAETIEIPAAETTEMPASEYQSGVYEFASPDDQGEEAAPTTYDMIGYCINLLASQAWQKLGLLADPQTGEAQPDLAEAKVAIDAVGDLAARLDSAPETIVPADLRRDLRTLVNDLRLNYVSQRGGAS